MKYTSFYEQKWFITEAFSLCATLQALYLDTLPKIPLTHVLIISKGRDEESALKLSLLNLLESRL